MNWVKDISDMHKKYGVNKAVRKMDPETLRKFLEFRIRFLQEELDEMKEATGVDMPNYVKKEVNGDDVVDALIDLCVVAIGTLDAFDVDAHEAWNRVHKANMNKVVGVKEGRPNPLGLPDLTKPEGWEAPSHSDNVGMIDRINKLYV